MKFILRNIAILSILIGSTSVFASETTNKESLAPAEACLSVVDFVLTGKVEGREPKEAVETFAAGSDRGYAFARLQVKNDSEVTFVWYRNGSEYSRVKMPVHTAQKWRTYASVKLRPGDWKVQLLSKDEVLAEKSFIVE